MAKKARDIMTPDCSCIGEDASALDAAKKLAELNVGSLPICGSDNRLKGMITDRDIVVKVLAQGKDPSSTQVGELGQGDGQTITIGADDSIEEALRTMSRAPGPPSAGHRRQGARRDRRPGRHRPQLRRGEGRRPRRGDLPLDASPPPPPPLPAVRAGERRSGWL